MRRRLFSFIGAVVAIGVFFGSIKACASCDDAKREREAMEDFRAECITPSHSEDEREVANCLDVAKTKCNESSSAARRACASGIAHTNGLR